jgi:hypothetical protein
MISIWYGVLAPPSPWSSPQLVILLFSYSELFRLCSLRQPEEYHIHLSHFLNLGCSVFSHDALFASPRPFARPLHIDHNPPCCVLS